MRRRAIPVLCWVAGLLILSVVGCAGPQRYDYTPSALREELYRRVPDLRPEEVVVPFEVTPGLVERARGAVAHTRSSERQVENLLSSLSDPGQFGLRYRWDRTTDARHTISERAGNCMSLSSVMVGLARGLGMRAYYAEATTGEREAQGLAAVGGVRVWSGHMAAMVFVSHGRAYVDFSGRLPQNARYRRIDDMRALAHFYNNQGYEIMLESQRSGTEVPWARVRRQFEIATRISPDFARAWNNLGVANARMGEDGAARHSYRMALRADPGLEAAQLNLTNLDPGQGSSLGMPTPLRTR